MLMPVLGTWQGGIPSMELFDTAHWHRGPHLYLYLSISIYPSICLSVAPSVDRSIDLSIYIYISISMSLYLYIYIHIYLSFVMLVCYIVVSNAVSKILSGACDQLQSG